MMKIVLFTVCIYRDKNNKSEFHTCYSLYDSVVYRLRCSYSTVQSYTTVIPFVLCAIL